MDSSSPEGRRQSPDAGEEKSWNIISHNTELIFLIAVGFVEILAEASGYRSFIRLNHLLPSLPNLVDNTTSTNHTELSNYTDYTTVQKVAHGFDMVGAYTVHITLASYILLPYPVITERQSLLLVPWLIITFLRSVVREGIISLFGVAVCAGHDVFHYPCLQYAVLQGIQCGFTVFFWTSVHSFYYYLNEKRSPEERVNSVISTIKRSSLQYDTSLQQTMERALSEHSGDEEDTEATLVERAALAWIAWEILENDGEYVTDSQFSQYLVVKATMELRQALRELAEKKRRKKRSLSPKQRIKETLEIMNLPEKISKTSRRRHSRTEAFETSEALSKRDPIRMIRPLTAFGKPVSSDMSMVTGISIFTDASEMSAGSVDNESQTEPPTHHMSRLLDILEFQQQQRLNRRLEEIKDDDKSLDLTVSEFRTKDDSLNSTDNEIKTMDEPLNSTDNEFKTMDKLLNSTNNEIKTMHEPLDSTANDL